MLTLRTATSADIAALAALVNSAYRGDSSRAGWTTEADLLGGQRTDAEALGALIESPEARLLVHEGSDGQDRERRFIACVLLERHGACVHIGMLTVDPRQQGRGLGRQLLEAAESYAREHLGAEVSEMDVIAQRPELIAWYERRGYRRTGHTRPFPYGDERYGLPQRPDLRFEVLVKDLPAAGR